MEQQSDSVCKTFKYKLQPTPEQARALERILWRCRTLYNTALDERKTAWERCQVSLTLRLGSSPAGSRDRRGRAVGGTGASPTGSA